MREIAVRGFMNLEYPDLNGNYFAILKGRLMQDGFFHIVLVSVGELEGQGDQSNFKYRDPLRKLGVDKLLMDYTIKWARMNGHNGITLECKYNLMDHYKKFGFVEDHIPQSDYYESLGEWRTMTLNFN